MGMQTGWSKATTSTPDALAALESFKTSANAIVDVTTTVVDMAKTILDFILKIMQNIKDLEAAALKAAISAARSILKDLTQSASANFLFVPIRATDPTSWTGSPSFYYLGGPPATGLPLIQVLPGPKYVSQPSGGTGGNFGFFTQVAESLQDDQDIMRPTYSEDAYVASMVLLAGVDPANLTNLIILAKKLAKLFGNVPGLNLIPEGLNPTPKGVRASIVPAPAAGSTSLADQWITAKPDFSTKPYAVRIDWERPVQNWIAHDFGSAEFEITHITIWRWPDDKYTAKQVEGVRDNYMYVTSDWSSAGSALIKRKDVEFEGISPLFYLDTTMELGGAYSYGISFKIAQNVGTTQLLTESDIISVRIDIPKTINLGPRRGVPPDWFSASIFGTIPGLSDALAKANAWLDALEASVKTANDDLQEFIDFLEAEVERYTSWIDEITATIHALIDALTWPSAYIGIWIMEPGKGGNDYFLGQLGKSLFNKDDPNRPPFDLGSELVCGFVLYSGSEAAGALEKFYNTIQLLFGSFVSGSTNAFLDAQASLGVLSDQLKEEICLTQALVRKVCEEEATALSTIGQSLAPAAESPDCASTGLSSVEPKSKFIETNDIWK